MTIWPTRTEKMIMKALGTNKEVTMDIIKLWLTIQAYGFFIEFAIAFVAILAYAVWHTINRYKLKRYKRNN